MCIFYRVRVAIDVAKPLKKQMKLKKDNGSWAFIDFRYERLPTFCFRCGLIGHGDRFCPKIAQGYDPKAEKLYGAWLRAGTRRTMPTSGQRWVAPESNADRLNWRSPAMESDKGEGVDDGGNMGAAPMQMVTSPNVLLPVVNANHTAHLLEQQHINSKFFHNSVKARKRRNRVHRLRNSEGVWVEDEAALGDVMVHPAE
nr:uncharacterized protein LOC109174453 [Ipomoea batatas]